MTSTSYISPITFLSEVAPFNLLDSKTVPELLTGSRTIQVDRGAIIANCRDAHDYVRVVLEGEVKCSLIAPSGNEKIIQIAASGDFFGEESALSGRPLLFTAEAIRDCVLLLVRSRALRAAMDASTAFSCAIAQRLSLAMCKLIENLQVCLQGSSGMRVAHYLCSLAPPEAERCEIVLDTNKQTIAAQLGMTPETLSRVLTSFIRKGVIRPHGRRGIVIEQMSVLRKYADA